MFQEKYCSSFTLSGSKCSRKAMIESSFCSQHQHNNRGPKQQKTQCEAYTKSGSRCLKTTFSKYCCLHSTQPIKEDKKCKGLQFDLSRCENICSDEYCISHKHKYRLEKPDDCPVCIDEISNISEIPLECGHWIHKECLKPTNIHKCPVCRQEMKNSEIEYIFGPNHIERNRYADDYGIFMNNLVLNNINENTERNSIPNIQNSQNIPDFQNIERNIQFLYNMLRELNPFSRARIPIQELEPVSLQEFNDNIIFMFRDYQNSNTILFERGIDDPYISVPSFYNIARRDYERYLVFVECFVHGYVNRYINNYTASDISRYTDIFTSALYVRRLKYIFNHINYNIQFSSETLRIFFEI